VAKAFLPGSGIEVVRAYAGEAQTNALFSDMSEWGLKRLRSVSPHAGEYEWHLPEPSAAVEMTDPAAVTTPVSVTMMAWRSLQDSSKSFPYVIDLSGWAVERLPYGATLEGLVWLEDVVLPTGLRVPPQRFFRGLLQACVDRHSLHRTREYPEIRLRGMQISYGVRISADSSQSGVLGVPLHSVVPRARLSTCRVRWRRKSGSTGWPPSWIWSSLDGASWRISGVSHPFAA
jgi:hypothetical protein